VQTDFITLIPFALLLLAVIGLWVHRIVWQSALALAIAAGYYTGAVTGPAVLWLALLTALAMSYAALRPRALTRRLKLMQALLGIAFTAFALALALNRFPGFPRTSLTGDIVLSPGAAPYNLGLGFPKVVTGILILGLINPLLEFVRSWRELGDVLKKVLPVFAVTVVVVMIATLAMGYVAFDPKWTSLFFAWAIANLFFTCLAEEAFFRAFVQNELAAAGGRTSLAYHVAVGVSAVLFGLAHLGGGWMYAFAATLAGLGYSIAYHRTGRVEAAMAVHFGVNTVHFLLFTYPRLA
jgi:membrane protease YdiL (CAAX protease family)